MLIARYSGAFRRDLRKAESRGKDMAKIKHAIQLLVRGEPIPISYRDHGLKGEWAGFRDLHLESDWIMIYRINRDRVEFERTGTHSDIFGR